MDREDCIQLLLSTLQKPQWKRSNSVADWDLKNVLWRAGCLLTPEQGDALVADTKRRGLITGRERRGCHRATGMWGVRITAEGEDWLLQRALAGAGGVHHLSQPEPALASDVQAAEPEPPNEEAVEFALQ